MNSYSSPTHSLAVGVRLNSQRGPLPSTPPSPGLAEACVCVCVRAALCVYVCKRVQEQLSKPQ